MVRWPLRGSKAAANLPDEPLDEPEESNGELAEAEAEAEDLEINVSEDVEP